MVLTIPAISSHFSAAYGFQSTKLQGGSGGRWVPPELVLSSVMVRVQSPTVSPYPRLI